MAESELRQAGHVYGGFSFLHCARAASLLRSSADISSTFLPSQRSSLFFGQPQPMSAPPARTIPIGRAHGVKIEVMKVAVAASAIGSGQIVGVGNSMMLSGSASSVFVMRTSRQSV